MDKLNKNRIKRRIKILNWTRLISLLYGIFIFTYRIKVYDGVLPDDIVMFFIISLVSVVFGLLIPSLIINDLMRNLSLYKSELIKKKKEFYISHFGKMIFDKKPNEEIIDYFDIFLSKYDDDLITYAYGLMSGIIYSDTNDELRETFTKYIKDNLLLCK